MKYRLLRKLVLARRWANTEVGERRIVRTLTTLSVVLIIDIVLLIIG